MEMCYNFSSATKAYVLICGIFIIFCHAVIGQDVTCNSIESNTTNVFATYNVSVSGASDYNLTYDPAEYGPTNNLPVGTTEVTVTALNSSSTVIGNCTFNVTVKLQELPITCPPAMVLTVGTDPGQAFYTYQPPTFNITYPSESMSYIPYGNITMMREYGQNHNSSLAISPPAHSVTISISDGTLQKVCNEATVTVEDQEPPTIVCPDDIFQSQTTVGSDFGPESFGDNAGSDGISIAVLPFHGPDFPIGMMTNYTFTVRDRAGNNASCSLSVTVILATTTTSTQAPLTATTGESSNPTESTPGTTDAVMQSTAESSNPTESTPGTTDAVMQSTAGLSSSDSLPIIIGCAVGGGVLLLIIIILAICCSSPGRRARFGIGVKEPGRVVGASRHGVATDPVLLNDRLQRTRSNIYAETTIDDVEMTEDSPDTMADTNGATGGGSNGVHTNDAYDEDDITLAKSVL